MDRDVDQQRESMCRHVVRLDRMSLSIPEVCIMLNFQKRFRKPSVWLVHSDQNCSLRKCARSDLKVSTLFGSGKFNSASREDRQHVIGIFRRLNQISQKLT